MIFEELTEFKKDLKYLKKKYRSLDEDLELVKKILRVLPKERPPFSFRLDNLGIKTCVIKVKKIACKALKGKGVNSGLRLIYAHFEVPKGTDKIVLVELYHKNNKATEDRERIMRNFE